MTKVLFRAPLLALGLGVMAFGQTPSKVGIINIQQAIVQTKDGQKAAADIETRFGPKRKEVDRKQSDLQQLEQQYRSGSNTMSDDAKQKMMRDIDQKRKQLQRDMDDAQAELEQEQGRVLQELGQKMMSLLDRYAAEHGYALILDVSSPQGPVLYASNTIDVTRDIVELYDKNAAAAPAAAGGAKPVAAPGAKPAAAPPAARPAAPRPAAAPKK